jgi:hypothetical protein
MQQQGSAGSPEAAQLKIPNQSKNSLKPLTAAGVAGLAASCGGGAGSDAANRSQRVSLLARTVLMIHRTAMNLLWSRMCCGDVDVAMKIGGRRYEFSVCLCLNNQQLLKHIDMKLCGNV